MSRRFQIVAGRVGPAWDSLEDRAQARYLRSRIIPGTDLFVHDATLYPMRFSSGMRAAADRALVVELEASLQVPRG